MTSIKEHQAYKNVSTDGIEPYDLAVNEANVANKKYWGLMKPLANSYRELYQHYLSNLNVYLKESEIDA